MRSYCREAAVAAADWRGLSCRHWGRPCWQRCGRGESSRLPDSPGSTVATLVQATLLAGDRQNRPFGCGLGKRGVRGLRYRVRAASRVSAGVFDRAAISRRSGCHLLTTGGAQPPSRPADLSMLSKAETERIWLPFTHWLTAAPALLRRLAPTLAGGQRRPGPANSIIFATGKANAPARPQSPATRVTPARTDSRSAAIMVPARYRFDVEVSPGAALASHQCRCRAAPSR